MTLGKELVLYLVVVVEPLGSDNYARPCAETGGHRCEHTYKGQTQTPPPVVGVKSSKCDNKVPAGLGAPEGQCYLKHFK